MEKPTTYSFMDLTGSKYGKLTVMEYAGCNYPHAKNKAHKWLCQCECGKQTIVTSGGLRNAKKPTRSCGCLQRESIKKRFINMCGLKFGRLTIIEYVENKHGHSYWLCQCECGNKKVISGQSLKKGLTKSCGCRQGNWIHGFSGTYAYKQMQFRDNPAKKLRHNIGGAIRKALNGTKKKSSITKYLPYTINQLKEHLESLWEPWMSWETYGGRNNSPEKTWQIDHIIPQSHFNFTSMDDPLFLECWALSNLRPLEKIANMRKRNTLFQPT